MVDDGRYLEKVGVATSSSSSSTITDGSIRGGVLLLDFVSEHPQPAPRPTHAILRRRDETPRRRRRRSRLHALLLPHLLHDLATLCDKLGSSLGAPLVVRVLRLIPAYQVGHWALLPFPHEGRWAGRSFGNGLCGVESGLKDGGSSLGVGYGRGGAGAWPFAQARELGADTPPAGKEDDEDGEGGGDEWEKRCDRALEWKRDGT